MARHSVRALLLLLTRVCDGVCATPSRNPKLATVRPFIPEGWKRVAGGRSAARPPERRRGWPAPRRGARGAAPFSGTPPGCRGIPPPPGVAAPLRPPASIWQPSGLRKAAQTRLVSVRPQVGVESPWAPEDPCKEQALPRLRLKHSASFAEESCLTSKAAVFHLRPCELGPKYYMSMGLIR
jgi:hypothetical protein